ncbi:MAG: DNA repair exonuclease [Thermoanaerobaculia bacterium]
MLPNPMRFVHAADIHLDSPLRNLALRPDAPIDRLRSATRSAFTNLIDLCIERQAAFLILAGDLYDHDFPNMQVALFLRSQLARLDQAGIRVVIAKGNHDADNKITSALALPGNTRILDDRAPESIRYDDLPVVIHGQSFRPGKITANLARDYPKKSPGLLNIGVLHTSLAGNADHDPYAPCSLDDLTTRGYAYWALGHIHKGAVLARDPWVVYPGNTQGRDAKETGPKGCVVVDVENDRVVSAETVATDVLRWQRAEIDLGDAVTEAELVERLRAALTLAHRDSAGRPSAVRAIFSGRTPLNANLARTPERFRQTVLELAAEIGGEDIWIEKINDETSAPSGPRRDENETASELIRIMQELAEDRTQIGPLLSAELEPLRSKLPEELKELPALELLRDAGLARELFTQLQPRLNALLAGEDD